MFSFEYNDKDLPFILCEKKKGKYRETEKAYSVKLCIQADTAHKINVIAIMAGLKDLFHNGDNTMKLKHNPDDLFEEDFRNSVHLEVQRGVQDVLYGNRKKFFPDRKEIRYSLQTHVRGQRKVADPFRTLNLLERLE